MFCRDVNKLLPEYTAEALTRFQRARVGKHLDACETCRMELARLDGVLRLVETHASVTPPSGLWEGVLHQIEAAEAPDGVRQTPDAGRRTSARGFPWAMPWPALSVAWRWAGGAALATGLAVTFWVTRTPWSPLAHRDPAGPARPVNISDPELVAAVQQHAFASSGQLFADRAGLESIVLLVRKNRETQ
jgi:hypothetical protein